MAASQFWVAIFYFDLQPVSRREGDSAIRAWAYTTGTCQVDARTGRVFDFSHKAAEILATGKAGPADWQAAERAERNWNAKVARTLILALPCELALDEQVKLLVKYARWLRQTRGVAVEWAVHEAPDDPRNCHGHLVITTRRVSDTGVHGKKTRELDVSGKSGPIILRWRQRWELTTNAALAAAGSEARIDHRSLQARGITRPARMHMGQMQTAQHRAGYDSGGGRLQIAVSDEQLAEAEQLAIHFGVGARQFLGQVALRALPGQPREDDLMSDALDAGHVSFVCSNKKLLRRIRRAAKAGGRSIEGFVATAVAGHVDSYEENMIVHPRTGRLLHANDDELYTREGHRMTAAPTGKEHEPKWQRTLHRQHVQFSAHLTAEQMERLEYPHFVTDCATDQELPCVLIPYDAEEGLPYLTVNGRDVAPSEATVMVPVFSTKQLSRMGRESVAKGAA